MYRRIAATVTITVLTVLSTATSAAAGMSWS